MEFKNMILGFIEKASSFKLYVFFFLITLSVYFPGINTPFYGDDFLVAIPKPTLNLFYYFTVPNDENSYRPLESMIQAVFQTFWGLNTVPLHLLSFALHALLALIVVKLLLQCRFDKVTSFMGGLFVLVSQSCVSAILGNDSLSQVMSGTFGFISLLLFSRYVEYNYDTSSSNEANYKYLFATILFFFMAICSKETSFGFLPVFLIWATYQAVRMKKHTIKSNLRNISLIVILGMIGLVFFYVRSQLVTSRAGDERYSMVLGFQIFSNIVMLLFSGITPFASVLSYIGFRTHNWIMMFFSVLGSFLVASTLIIGFIKCKSKTKIIVFFASAVACMLPVAILAKVSELYTYTFIGFISMLWAILVIELIRKSEKQFWRYVFITFAALTLGLNIASVYVKVSMINRTGFRAQTILTQFERFVRAAPKSETILLVNSHELEPEYSIYRLSGFQSLCVGEYIPSNTIVGWNRPDVRIQLIDKDSVNNFPSKNTTFLYLEGDKVLKELKNRDGRFYSPQK